MPITRILAWPVLLVTVCASLPTGVEENRESLEGSTGIASSSSPQADACGRGGPMVVRCVRSRR